MKIGMLWFDCDPKTTLIEKIATAAAYYAVKYGTVPNMCHVHPNMLDGNPRTPPNIVVKPNRSVLPNHFWIGTGD